MNALLAHKGEFVLSYNEQYPQQVKKIKDIDWSQTRVIFVANDYTPYQYGAINNPDLPIDLVMVKKYNNGFVNIDTLSKASTKQNSSRQQNNLEVTKKGLSEEIKVYTEQDHVQKGSIEIQELYEELKEIILSWDSKIKIKPTKLS